MPSSAWFLQNVGLPLPSTLWLALATQAPCAQLFFITFSMPSWVCFLQNVGLLLPSTLKTDSVKQASYEAAAPDDVDHAIFSMFLAVCPRLASLQT